MVQRTCALKYNFICQVLEDKCLELVKVHTDHNPADFLTKSLPSDKFAHCRELMGIGLGYGTSLYIHTFTNMSP